MKLIIVLISTLADWCNQSCRPPTGLVMYICLCTAVTESDVAVSIEAGASSFEEVQFATGLGTCCGQCSAYAREHVALACTRFCGNDAASECRAREMDVPRVSRRAPLVPLTTLQQAA